VMESTPALIPQYEHTELNRVFGDLEAHILRHLELVNPTNTVILQFAAAPDAPFVHYAQVKDERALRRSVWILGIRSDIPASNVMRMTPNLAKVCSAQGVTSLLKRALPGLELTHVPSPPAVIQPQADMQYFAIATTGPCWEHILATKQVGIYVPGELGKAFFEVTIITEATS
jgi:type VI secretion system protein ImpJ